jgi:hypothetical protein
MSGRGGAAPPASGAAPDAAGSAAADPGPSAASCWTAKRLRLRDWLEQTAPYLAPVYVGAVAMVFDVDFPAGVRVARNP